jgi:hypothetical protein
MPVLPFFIEQIIEIYHIHFTENIYSVFTFAFCTIQLADNKNFFPAINILHVFDRQIHNTGIFLTSLAIRFEMK